MKKPSLPPAQAISLDVDGTLYRVERRRVFIALWGERRFVARYLAVREEMRNLPAFESPEALFEHEADRLAAQLDASVDTVRPRIQKVRTQLAEILTRPGPYPGVRAALEAAVVHGIKLVILSDYEAEDKLKHLGLADLPFEGILSAEHSGALKPSPEAFRSVPDALGLPPEAIVHIGDRESLDVHGALGVGMRAWRLSRNPLRPTAAEFRFRAWRPELLQPLYGQ